jgi:hypothetical protein
LITATRKVIVFLQREDCCYSVGRCSISQNIDSGRERGSSTYRRDEGLLVGRLSVEGYYVSQNINSSRERFSAVSHTRSILAIRGNRAISC